MKFVQVFFLICALSVKASVVNKQQGVCKKNKCVDGTTEVLLELGEDQITTLFSRADKNGDGEISKKESKQFRRKVLKNKSLQEYLATAATV